MTINGNSYLMFVLKRKINKRVMNFLTTTFNIVQLKILKKEILKFS